jgi:hypothetical protein
MTNTEALEFVGLIKSYYPRWEGKDEEFEEWVNRLGRFDFDRAVKALKDYFFENKARTIEPIPGKILRVLRQKAYIIIDTGSKEPIKVFELYQEENPRRKQAFFVGSETELRSRPEQSYEEEAEIKRNRVNQLYGGNWIVIQDWKSYFGTN